MEDIASEIQYDEELKKLDPRYGVMAKTMQNIVVRLNLYQTQNIKLNHE